MCMFCLTSRSQTLKLRTFVVIRGDSEKAHVKSFLHFPNSLISQSRPGARTVHSLSPPFPSREHESGVGSSGAHTQTYAHTVIDANLHSLASASSLAPILFLSALHHRLRSSASGKCLFNNCSRGNHCLHRLSGLQQSSGGEGVRLLARTAVLTVL